MESQIKQLKLNATNIKSSLINGNKELKKLRIKERNLFNLQRISAKRLQKENFTEGKGSGSGVGGYLKQKALAPTMSIIDSLKEFAGNILLGILINTLPTAIKKVEQFLEDNKDIIETVKNVITSTGSALQILVNIFDDPKKAPDLTKLKEENKELEELKKEFESGGRFEKEIDGLVKETDNLEDEFKDEFKEQYTARTPEQVRTDVATSLPGSGLTLKNLSFKVNTFKTLQNAAKNNNLSSIGYSANDGTVRTIPGVGSYTVETDKAFGLSFGNPYLVTRDVYGTKISEDDFAKRVSAVEGSGGDYSELLGILSSMGEDNELAKTQGYSEGGLVSKRGPSRSQNLTRQGQSAEEKIAMRQFGSFLNLKDSVIKESKLLETSEKSQEEMRKALRDLKTYLELTKPELPKSSIFTLPSSEHSGPTSPLPGTGSLSSPMIDATGEPGVDFTPAGSNNRAVFAGEVVEIGHQYNPSVIGGDDRMGSGYGNYVVIRSQDPNNPGKYFDGLYAHFPDGEIKVSQGQKVQKGDILGRMATAAEYENPKTRPRVGSGTGAHTSLDFLNPGSNQPYSNWKGLVPLVDPSFSSSNVKPKGYGKDGGGSNLLQSFDTGSEVVMIMAQQPVIVPGPTRYITRTRTQTMPVPVQIAPKSSGLRSLV